MSERLDLVDLTTGRLLRELPDVDFSWDRQLRDSQINARRQNMNEDGITSLSLPWNAFDDETNYEQLFMPGYRGVLYSLDGVPQVLSEISDTVDDGDTIQITLNSIRAMLDRLHVIPEQAVQDQMRGDPTAIAHAVLTINGVDLGSIGKRELIAVTQKGHALPPISFDNDRPGNTNDHERNVRGFNLANITAGHLLDNLANLGPDIDIRPVMVDDRTIRLNYTWGHPQLTQPRIWTFDWKKGAPGGDVLSCSFQRNADNLADRVYATGGGSDEQTLVAVAQSPRIPSDRLMREKTVSDTSIEDQGQLQNLADNELKVSQDVQGQLTIRLAVHGVTPVSRICPGDLADITIAGLPSMNNARARTYRMRFMRLSGEKGNPIATALMDVVSATSYDILEE
ncbi:hypothetical protein [Bifidobacterium mongoliense]|uniref:Uncharacterized protein n=1 Tax=Bifidobacterium mongoliense DSM 21395 TaxID=1437603 RepID=A0A087BZT3_9BIFI|nr:hypothetical protein [Bifidobacterium mongoliense]KFI76533.1 hypothetical protein BMON_1130 [Bifidobacterium mongoliense DSM 21395]